MLRPFARWLADLVRTDNCVGSDDTSIRLLLPEEIPEATADDPKSGRVREVFEAAKSQGLKSIIAKMWAYRGVRVWDQLRSYLEHEMTDVLSSDKISEARSYILNQWQGLTAHLADGNIPIDNNQCEQLMKQVDLGRKNWLHLGSLASGYRTATLLTIVSSAIRNDLDVAAYLEDILNQLLSGSLDYESLRPDVWAASHPESIRAHRQKQREEHNIRRERDRLRRRLARLEK